jgi:hypothetical protein
VSDFLVLHTLRVKGLTSLAVVSAQTGLPAAQADEVLRRLAGQGLVTMREGRVAGALLTPAGKQTHAELLAQDADTRDAAAALAAAYEEFLPVNGEFKRVCQSWQVRPDGQPNDHADAGYDAGVISQLAGVHERLLACVLEPLEKALPRFAAYPARLTAALDRVRGGDAAAFARPMADSYHDIWMELHQDLLLSAGRERGAADEG